MGRAGQKSAPLHSGNRLVPHAQKISPIWQTIKLAIPIQNRYCHAPQGIQPNLIIQNNQQMPWLLSCQAGIRPIAMATNCRSATKPA